MNSIERQNNNIELGEKNEWSKLEGLAQDGPLVDNVSEAVKNETREKKKKAEELERERRNAEYEAEKARREEEALARDMATARNVFDRIKRDRFKKQRIQEIVERDLNSRLLKVEDLEEESISGNPEVYKHFASFDGAEIPIYDLRGIPFSILSTTIDYRSENKPGEIGTETFRKVLEDPSVWAERRDEAEKAPGWGTRNSDARGNTISASYRNSDLNLESSVNGNLVYGFAGVEADSIISIDNRDGGTSNMAGDIETILSNPDVIKMLEGAEGTATYNEVVLRRYSENGIPKKPDYIIIENGKITKEALRHAKYFNIPIINIEKSIYREKIKKKGEGIITSIDEDDSYEEIDKKIADLLSMSSFKYIYHTLEGIGRNRDIPQQFMYNSPLGKQCLRVMQLEQLKRLGFIKDALEEAINNLELATESGQLAAQALPMFDDFDIQIFDIQNGLWSKKDCDTQEQQHSVPGNCNYIDINFRLKGSSRNVKTQVYDGERIYKAEEALANGSRTEEDIKNADSSFYDTLKPVALRYFETFRRNRALRPSNQTAE